MAWLRLRRNGRVAHRTTANTGFMAGLVTTDCGDIYALHDMRAVLTKEPRCKKCTRRR